MKESAMETNRAKNMALVMLTSLSVLSLVSCVEEPSAVVPVVSSVNVVDSTLSRPALNLPNCQYQGQVIVKTVDRFRPDNLVVTEPEMIALKDKTMQLQGNTAVIQKNYLLHQNNMFVHMINADAYFCHPTTGY